MARIELVRVIDSGGMGDVYEARAEVCPGRYIPVAVKMIRTSEQGLARRARFIREVDTALEFSHRHPNLATTHWYGVTEANEPFLVMELVDASVKQLREASRMDWPCIRRIARDMSSALAFLHEHDIIHRDISPGNVLLCRDGRVLVGDFGLVRRDSGSVSNGAQGTPGFAAPELFNNIPNTNAADIYSLGAVLYQLATGGPPEGKSPACPTRCRAISSH